ncbi:MAG: hypothetical protein R2715_19345 [Ilumatobacteraceae bacterium]
MSDNGGMPIRLPDANGLSSAISSLLGVSTFVTKAQAPLLFTVANRRAYAALYVTAEGFCSAVVAFDLKLAAGSRGDRRVSRGDGRGMDQERQAQR